MNSKGVLIVVSGPSGCGKGTVCSRLLKKDKNTVLSVSATTRNMREGEKEGESYFFITKEKFDSMIENGEFLEYNCGYGENYYGTPRKYVEENLENGKDVILEIEMNGARNIKKAYPECVTVFLAPPSLEELKRRLISRGRETAEQVELRFNEAKAELKRLYDYDYVIVNDEIDDATSKLYSILTAEKCAVKRNENIENTILKGDNQNV